MISINDILKQLENGDLSVITTENVELINSSALRILDTIEYSQKDIMEMGLIIRISNILYNNTDMDKLPLEHGVYDLLLELYKQFNPMYQVGAEPIHFNTTTKDLMKSKSIVNPIKRLDRQKLEDALFLDDLNRVPILTQEDFLKNPISREDNTYITKRLVNQKHSYPELVGTLDKCKFVLSTQAHEKGSYYDSNVKILERDFFGKHISEGYINPNEKLTMILELKYDGVSVEADVSNIVNSARSRGDANEDIAADLTPILGGYIFNQAYSIPNNEVFGMKFEAIMTYLDLEKYNNLKNKNYKNCRTAISGLFSSSEAYKYRDLITLVPLATSLNLDRLTEIEFMNKYYHSGEQLRYAVIEGNYTELLFQIKRFVEEAEYMRPFMPFMYDGVVVSYTDQRLKKLLGRVNAVNKWSIAIKFNPLKKLTIFRGYSFTVGQDGSITPMIHYDPVEFYGGIHTKSSGQSYDRFKTLSLRIGDIIPVEYVNDVMPYVGFKEDNSANAENTNPIVEFITNCPSCGSQLILSDSGKSIKCPNIECPDRNLSRMVAMMDKLNIKDFSEAYLRQIAKYTLTELLYLTRDDVSFLGDITSQKFIDRMNDLRTREIYDFNMVGALGFTGIAKAKWKLILCKYSLDELMSMNHEQLKFTLVNIKGIGPVTADVIINEFDFFRKDLVTINSLPNIIITKGMKVGKVIRLTGFRNQQLIEQLNDMGHDAGEGSVTKTTDILLVPTENHKSSKVDKALKNEFTQIISVDEFISNMDKYL